MRQHLHLTTRQPVFLSDANFDKVLENRQILVLLIVRYRWWFGLFIYSLTFHSGLGLKTHVPFIDLPQSPVTVNQDPASSSHQRLLALSHADVERRLIDNKSLLTIVDKPALRQLPTLVTALAQRVESDKAVLACVGQIKRSDPALDLNDTRWVYFDILFIK